MLSVLFVVNSPSPPSVLFVRSVVDLFFFPNLNPEDGTLTRPDTGIPPYSSSLWVFGVLSEDSTQSDRAGVRIFFLSNPVDPVNPIEQ